MTAFFKLTLGVIALTISLQPAHAQPCTAPGVDLAFCGGEGATIEDCGSAAVAASCPVLCGSCPPTQASISPPKVATHDGDLILNSATNGKVLVNSVDVLASATERDSTISAAQSEIDQLRGVVDTQALDLSRAMLIINDLTQFQETSLERLRILELTGAPTTQPTMAPTPLSNSPTSAPSVSPSQPSGTTPQSAGRTCYTLWRSGITSNGAYWVDPDGPGGTAPTLIQCDMSGGGYNVVNVRRQVDVGGRHIYRRSTFTVENFNAPSANYNFGRVRVGFQFAGELDDSNTNVRSWVNGQQVSFWRNGRCNTSPVTPDGWPRTATINAASFYLASRPEGDVDAGCGGGIPSHGRNWFIAEKVQIIPR